MMGGTVLVESEAGEGSTFTMRLPAVVEEPLLASKQGWLPLPNLVPVLKFTRGPNVGV